MPKPTSLFKPYSLINRKYGDLRALTVERGFAPKERPACINHYAVGFVREIAAQVLAPEELDQILAKYGGRGVWKSANHLLKFTPELVKAVIASGLLSESEFARKIGDHDAFMAFVSGEKMAPNARPGSLISEG